MIYALYIEQKITIFALYTKHKYKNQINNLTMENEPNSSLLPPHS